MRLFGQNRKPLSVYAVSRLHYGLHEAYRKTLLYFRGTAWKSSVEGEGEPFPCGFKGDRADSEIMDFEGDYEKCRTLVKKVVRLFELQDISGIKEARGTLKPLQKKNPVVYYALDNFPKLMSIISEKSLKLPNDFNDDSIFYIKGLKDIINSGKELCKKDWGTVKSSFEKNSKVKEKLLRKSCFGIAYMEHLVKKIYNIKPTAKRPLLAAHEINGMDAGWTMGAVIFNILTDSVHQIRPR